jgi:hypothetical protein
MNWIVYFIALLGTRLLPTYSNKINGRDEKRQRESFPTSKSAPTPISVPHPLFPIISFVSLKCIIVPTSYPCVCVLVGLIAASGEDHVLGSETKGFLSNRNAALEEEGALSEIGILGAKNTKIFDSDSDLYLTRCVH